MPVERADGTVRKQPYYIHPVQTDAVLSVAGLYELWRDPERTADDPNRWLWTATVITCDATGPAGEIHDRTPMILPEERVDAWLDPDLTDKKQVRELLTGIEVPPLEARAVSPAVNRVGTNRPELLEPIDTGADQQLQLALAVQPRNAAAAPLPHAGSVPSPRRLPPEMSGPVQLAVARAAEVVPAETACPGGCIYEIKFDGYRLAVVCTDNAVKLWSRRGTDLTSAFPDLAAAAEFQLQSGAVLDGEAVVWANGRLSSDHLQQRMDRRASRSAPSGPPASYVAFDVLAQGGEDHRRLPYTTRRARLERLAASWAPPLQLCPSTADRVEALRWYEDYRAAGIEGLVVKSAHGRYSAGRGDWIKVRNRQTREVIVGAVTGPITQPTAVIAAVLRDGELVVVGRTAPLSAAQSRDLAAHLSPAGADHPWPDEIGSGVFGYRQRVLITKVSPVLVLEVAADPALHAGGYRHLLRYVRLRADMDPIDVAAP
jgi:ATP-dependent DNA ligase